VYHNFDYDSYDQLLNEGSLVTLRKNGVHVAYIQTITIYIWQNYWCKFLKI